MWRNNLQKLTGLWDMDITLQNGGCSISLEPVDWSVPKLHQVGAFWTYLTGYIPWRPSGFWRWALLYRPFNVWCKLGQKCLFRGSASMEVRWPQLLWILNLWQKSTGHAKFGHYRTPGSWVMSLVVQKTSNAHPPFLMDPE